MPGCPMAVVSSLHAAIKKIKYRDRTLGRLEVELSKLIQVLSSTNVRTSASMVLRGLITRCSIFEESVSAFKKAHNQGYPDWGRMEFMGSDINSFIDLVEEFKSVLLIDRGNASPQTSWEYNEMVRDTTYALGLRLQRIDERILKADPNLLISLIDEKTVVQACLGICEDATPCSGLLRSRRSSSDDTSKLGRNRAQDPRQRGHANMAGPNFLRKSLSFKVEEAITDRHSDQVIVYSPGVQTSIEKMTSQNGSRQLLGSMTDNQLSWLVTHHYHS